MDTGEPLSTVRERIQSANAYLGAWPMVEALNRGAQVVITGRATDTGLTLAPLVHEFGWGKTDWDRLSAGTIAGHIIECGAQSSAALPVRWRLIPDLGHVGVPIVKLRRTHIHRNQARRDWGARHVRNQGTTLTSGDPHAYITPLRRHFTTIQLRRRADRVRVFGIKGKPATEFLKVSISYLRLQARNLVIQVGCYEKPSRL